ncbi:MAG: YlmC/YmxH family sporulation protein [Lachnospiraceae bacterium]|nr:YlmC/YmxH family sporulation protein [Lachnospiraceae bacterium]
MRICELKQKEVINICDCKRLGYIVDVEFDVRSGCICAFIIPGPGGICGLFGREYEYVIPFGCVRQIGEDIVLVEVNPEDIMHKCGG